MTALSRRDTGENITPNLQIMLKLWDRCTTLWSRMVPAIDNKFSAPNKLSFGESSPSTWASRTNTWAPNGLPFSALTFDRGTIPIPKRDVDPTCPITTPRKHLSTHPRQEYLH